MQNDWFERPNAGPGRIMEAASHQPLSPHSGLNTVLGLGIMNGQNGEKQQPWTYEQYQYLTAAPSHQYPALCPPAACVRLLDAWWWASLIRVGAGRSGAIHAPPLGPVAILRYKSMAGIIGGPGVAH